MNQHMRKFGGWGIVILLLTGALYSITFAQSNIRLFAECTAIDGNTQLWRVENPTGQSAPFNWQSSSTGQSGNGTIPANGEVTFQTLTTDGTNSIDIYWDGRYVTTVSGATVACSSPVSSVTDVPPVVTDIPIVDPTEPVDNSNARDDDSSGTINNPPQEEIVAPADNSNPQPADVAPICDAQDCSSIQVIAVCASNLAIFQISNVGGDMAQAAQWRLYVGDSLVDIGSYVLDSNTSGQVTYESNGVDIRIEVEQQPWISATSLNSSISCGTASTPAIDGTIDLLSIADGFVNYCDVVNGQGVILDNMPVDAIDSQFDETGSLEGYDFLILSQADRQHCMNIGTLPSVDGLRDIRVDICDVELEGNRIIEDQTIEEVIAFFTNGDDHTYDFIILTPADRFRCNLGIIKIDWCRVRITPDGIHKEILEDLSLYQLVQLLFDGENHQFDFLILTEADRQRCMNHGRSTSTPIVSPTASETPTATPTGTLSATPVPSETSTATNTPTETPTPTATETATATQTDDPSQTPTNTATATSTATNTATATNTPTNTPTATATATTTATSTPTNTVTPTGTPFSCDINVTAGDAQELLEAVDLANSEPSISVICLGGGTYNLSAQISYETEFRIVGNGSTITSSSLNVSLIVVRGFSGNAIIENTVISGGNANFGGAIRVLTGGSFFVYNSTIRDNNATNGGGAVYVENGYILLDNTTLFNNSATGNGGAILAQSGAQVSLVNATVEGNEASVGGAFSIEDSQLGLNDNTRVVGNTSTAGASVLASTGTNSEVNIRDSIIQNNTATASSTITTNNANFGMQNTCLENNSTAAGSVDLFNSSASTIIVEDNWWGSEDGPSTNPNVVVRETVSANVDFTPFLTTKPAFCD